tara:strand:- start:1420 stop:2373 length:954 start_codon:yes stop_codon:yes gene_type:complete
MKSIKFAQKRAYLVTSKKIKDIISSRINNILKIDLNYKSYKLLNDSNLTTLNDTINDYFFSPVTYGQKFMLFLTKINGKNMSAFINKKKKDIIVLNMKFGDNLYKNTLIDGELFKNNDGSWFYQTTDVYLYKNKNFLCKELTQRYNILNYIAKHDYKYNEDKDSFCLHVPLLMKLRYFKDFYENKRHELDYKVSGMVFKYIGQTDNKKDYIYIFPENRKNQKSKIIFSVKETLLPDVYELYCVDDKNKNIKFGIASIPSMAISKMMGDAFKTNMKNGSNTPILFECEFARNFKKFVPKKQVYKQNLSFYKDVSKILK